MRQSGSSTGKAQPYQEPVDLSATRTRHGSHRAYRFYRCRCQECVDFIRSWYREYWELHRTYVHPKGRKTGQQQPRLTEEQVREIRATTGPYGPIAERYGVTTTTIGHIRRRETWRHLDD